MDFKAVETAMGQQTCIIIILLKHRNTSKVVKWQILKRLEII